MQECTDFSCATPVPAFSPPVTLVYQAPELRLLIKMERLRMDQSLAPCINHNFFPTAWLYTDCTCHMEFLRHNDPNTQKAHIFWFVSITSYLIVWFIFLLPLPSPTPHPKANFLALNPLLSPKRGQLGELTSLSGFVTGFIYRDKSFFNTRNMTGVKKQIQFWSNKCTIQGRSILNENYFALQKQFQNNYMQL